MARGVGDPLFEKISCPVPLRTGMSCEPEPWDLRAHHSLPMGGGRFTRLIRAVPPLLGWKVIV